MKVYLVRHGQTILNEKSLMQGWADGPLTPEGVDKAIQMGKFLKDIPFDVAISSDLRRAHHTCEYIVNENKRYDGKIDLDQSLREMYFGEYEADYVDSVWEHVIQKKNIPNFDTYKMLDRMAVMYHADDKVPAEEFKTFRSRVIGGFKQQVHESFMKGYENILIVSHGVTIATILDEVMQSSELKTSLPNASLCTFEYDGFTCTAEQIGFTPWSV